MVEIEQFQFCYLAQLHYKTLFGHFNSYAYAS